MEHTKTKGNIRKICCIGCDNYGMYACCVIAKMCPEIHVAITDLTTGRISQWNTNSVVYNEPGLEEILLKCQNRNLTFTADLMKAIKDAEVIFLSLSNPFSKSGAVKGTKTVKLEKAARLISKFSKTNKIVVEKSTMPIGNTQLLSSILNQNKIEKVKFQVLSNPDFCSPGNVIDYLLNPDRVVIGSGTKNQELAAANSLASIYARWVPKHKILTVNSWSSELGKLATNAFLAQKLSSISALSIICEQAKNVDVSEILRIYSEVTGNSQYLEPSFRFGGKSLQNDLLTLIYMCRELKLMEIAEYWQDVLNMNELHTLRFKRKILSEYYLTLTNKKFAIWGFAYKKNAKSSINSPALNICKSLLEEGAKVAIYDPTMEKKQIMEDLKSIEYPHWETKIVISDNPYRAAYKSHGIVCCTDNEEFKSLDYMAIHRNMMKPAFIFDGRKFLPHENLIKMDFVVNTIGKDLKHLEVELSENSENNKI